MVVATGGGGRGGGGSGLPVGRRGVCCLYNHGMRAAVALPVWRGPRGTCARAHTYTHTCTRAIMRSRELWPACPFDSITRTRRATNELIPCP